MVSGLNYNNGRLFKNYVSNPFYSLLNEEWIIGYNMDSTLQQKRRIQLGYAKKLDRFRRLDSFRLPDIKEFCWNKMGFFSIPIEITIKEGKHTRDSY